jgi:RimJ/RimL family protein N-acetyltransferase
VLILEIRLESKNIILRPSSFKDCKLFAVWEEKEYVRRFFTMNDNRDYEEITREFIIRSEISTNIQLTIIHKTSLRPIGRIFLSKFNENEDSIDITRIYLGEEEFLRKGLGREALNLMLKYFFEMLKLERVTIDFFLDNRRAENLYISLGFKSEGIMRHVSKKNQNYIDLHLMSLLSHEYFS